MNAGFLLYSLKRYRQKYRQKEKYLPAGAKNSSINIGQGLHQGRCRGGAGRAGRRAHVCTHNAHAHAKQKMLPGWGWRQGKALSRPIPARCEASQQGQQRGRQSKAAKNGAVQGLGRRGKGRNSMKRMNFFHYIKLFSLCSQFVPALFSVLTGCKPAWLLGLQFCSQCSQCFCNLAAGVNLKKAIYAARWGSSSTSAPLRILSRWFAHWFIMARRSAK